MSSALRAPAVNQGEYLWPNYDLPTSTRWRRIAAEQAYRMEMPESLEDLAADSRWPAFFPSSISLVTTSDGHRMALEKVVGASIVNRFPYVIALSFCRQHLSDRHHARGKFAEILERGGTVAVQFMPPGPELNA